MARTHNVLEWTGWMRMRWILIRAVGRGATQEVAGLRKGRPSVRDGTREPESGMFYIYDRSSDVFGVDLVEAGRWRYRLEEFEQMAQTFA
jgi:hypothetical protein